MAQDLISIKTRQVFRENMVGWVLREIADEFDAARINCDLSYHPPVTGQRRALVEQYYSTVNWSAPDHIKRVLKVFENVLHRAEKLADEVAFTPELQEQRKREVEKLIHFLELDGLRWAAGRITQGSDIPLLENIKSTAIAFDVKYMSEQIQRMQLAIETDPALAIGTAKELIETCCKTILEERGKPIAGTPDISTLTKQTLRELKLVPEGIPESTRGADIIKRLLSNLGTIGNGLAELRGLYGTGHGKHGKTSGLGVRHARLAVGASATLVQFLFDTHREIK